MATGKAHNGLVAHSDEASIHVRRFGADKDGRGGLVVATVIRPVGPPEPVRPLPPAGAKLDPDAGRKWEEVQLPAREYGYGGSGPAELALAILSACVGGRVADDLYQRFKNDRIAPEHRLDWTITAAAVREWVHAARGPAAAVKVGDRVLVTTTSYGGLKGIPAVITAVKEGNASPFPLVVEFAKSFKPYPYAQVRYDEIDPIPTECPDGPGTKKNSCPTCPARFDAPCPGSLANIAASEAV